MLLVAYYVCHEIYLPLCHQVQGLECVSQFVIILPKIYSHAVLQLNGYTYIIGTFIYAS